MHNSHASPRTRAPLRLILLVALVGLLVLAGALAWLAWQFERLDEPTQDALRKAVFILPLALISGGTVYAAALLWRIAGMSSSLANWFQALNTWATSHGTASLHTIQYKPQISSTAAEPLALADAALTLPDNVALAGVLSDLPSGQLAYGVLPDGKPLALPLAAGYHILAHGDTRSGKTNFLDGLLVQLHHKAAHYPLHIVAGDFKRELAATWNRSRLVRAVETNPQSIAELIEEATRGPDGILNRYAQFERIGAAQGRIVRNMADYVKVMGRPLPLTFLVIDELNAVLEAADRKSNLGSALKIALQTGAGAGVYIAGGAQYLSSATFGRDGSKQFVTRCHFGAFDSMAIRVMFGEKLDAAIRPLLTGQAGRGLIRTAGQTQAAPFQALRCDEDDILGAIRLLTDDAPTIEIPETLKQVGNASETPETSFTITPEIVQIVKRLHAEKRGKKEVVALIWGAKPGGSDSYKQASAAYDQIVRDL